SSLFLNLRFVLCKVSSSSDDSSTTLTSERRRSSLSTGATIDELRSNYEKVKVTVCILKADVSTHFSSREVFIFHRLEESDELEMGIREFMRAIYFVLESKRLDLSFEKMECPPCPVLPEEEKFRIGVENKTSKTYKRKCIGRSRKQNSDYAMLTGLPQLALDSYGASIEMLKTANDMLWFAGLLPINSTVSYALGCTSWGEVFFVIPQSFLLDKRGMLLRYFLKARMGIFRFKEKIEPSAILEKFEQALENYSKFSFAAMIEYDCMMKAVSLYRYHQLFKAFHRDHVSKYLEDSFTRFDNHTKAAICNNSGTLYREVGFTRKCSFFARLSVLFHKINEIGPVHLQIKALHEVYTAASRAELTDAAIRHLCHLIQVYYDDMDPSLANRLFEDLQNLVRIKGSTPQLNQRISVPVGNIILPPIQLTRFPMVSDPMLCPLPPHLAPTVIHAKVGQPELFIYSPFQQKRSTNAFAPMLHHNANFQLDCACEVAILIYNCRPHELVVRELCLLADGCAFESVPMRLMLPAAAEGTGPARIKLIGVPRTPGLLTITGYCCEVFGVKNVQDFVNKNNSLFCTFSIQVEVLPSLPVLQFESSLPRAPIEEDLNEPSAEITVYSGQVFKHSLTVKNTSSTISIKKIRLQLWQPKVSGGPSLIELTNQADDESFSLAPLEEKDISFQIFGIDPTATADDEGNDDKVLETVLPLASTAAEAPDTDAHDLIPYTGRLLSSEFDVHFCSTEQKCLLRCRTGRLSIAVCVVPAVTVSAWHVLPGDGPFTRYIVVDVTNSTEHDSELVYSSNRRMSVLPKETCRVPLLSPCCSDVAGRAFHAATQKDSHMMQKLEMVMLRVILSSFLCIHFDTTWTYDGRSLFVFTFQLEGLVPVGALLSSVSLLKQLVLPAISLDISVNGTPYLSEDDICVGIGEIIHIKVVVISSLEYDFDGILTLDCYQEISSFFGTVDKSENLLIIGQRKIPFVVPKSELSFHVMFRVEGVHKIRPHIVSRNGDESLFADEIFVSPVGFSVSSKAH
ncbi:unnamed protein product, partial [Angiostrongylus costaricensis]|uniref:Foie-gras_1 domain-containing protein n=1 Tax=Angiostrongylus costaricensis TaxID=334426 RepID=A0A0R3PD73_ANGCS